MSTSAYQEALQATLGHEGGYYDGSEARDPNPTNYGVTQRIYDSYRAAKGLVGRPVKLIEQHEVEDIYRSYWTEAKCDLLPRLAAITMFDMSINAGPAGAVKCLQRVLGVEPDGAFGPQTQAALAACTLTEETLAARLCWARLRYYLNLVEHNARLVPNLPSWLQRVVQFVETYLA